MSLQHELDARAPILSARPGINGDAIWELPLPATT